MSSSRFSPITRTALPRQHGQSSLPHTLITSLTRCFSQVYGKNQTLDPTAAPLEKGQRPDLPLDRVLGLVVDAFTGATERHIEVGDGLEMFVVEVGKGVRLISKGQFHTTFLYYHHHTNLTDDSAQTGLESNRNHFVFTLSSKPVISSLPSFSEPLKRIDSANSEIARP